MSDAQSLISQIYSDAESRLSQKNDTDRPVYIGETLLKGLISEYEQETGNKAEPNEKGIYELYGIAVAVFNFES